MKLFENITEFWQMTWKRTIILVGLFATLLLILTSWQIALGVLLGGLILLGDIYLLKVPLETILKRTTNKKYQWVLFLSLVRIIILGAVLLFIIKFHVTNIIGVFIGVTLPILSIVSLLFTGGLTQWKV
jgi:hypothetical protein